MDVQLGFLYIHTLHWWNRWNNLENLFRVESYLGLVPRNLKTLKNEKFDNLNCYLWGKISKMIIRMNVRILTNSPYIRISLIFWKCPFRVEFPMVLFVKIFRNHIYGEFVPGEFALVIIFWFSLRNNNLGLKMKILKFLEIQPTLNGWPSKLELFCYTL